MLLFFFFQAEDGIRDYKVTGVQTCALPIYHGSRHDLALALFEQDDGHALAHVLTRDVLEDARADRKSTRLNSSHLVISYAVFCLKKKKIHLLNLHLSCVPTYHLHSSQRAAT